MGPIPLFSIATLIWGSTWLAITFQLGIVPPEASVAYRFALSSLMMAAWCLVTGRSLRFARAQHAWFAAQGALLFGLNYLCVYWAQQYIASGLVAVLFSLIVFLNLIGVRVFFATAFDPRTVLGAALGITGVALLFWRELAAMQNEALRGIAFGLASAVLASGGNKLAVRSQRRGIPLLPSVAWAMAYGAVTVAAIAVFDDVAWTFDPRRAYVLSLLYLAVFGSVIAFAAYLTLLGKIGAARAGYVGVAVPVVALLLSTVFEHYEWTMAALVGALLCITGNVLVLMRQRRTEAD